MQPQEGIRAECVWEMMKPYVAGFEERKGRRGEVGVLKVRVERWTF